MTTPTTTRMTAPRLARLIADGDAEAVRAAVQDSPRLLTATVERDGQGGWTPLHLAVADGRADVVRLLVEAGADLRARTEHGRDPLHTALESAPDLVPLLRELGAPVDAASAAYLDDVEQLRTELDGGAPLTDPVTGVDLLTLAAAGGAAASARTLLDRGWSLRPHLQADRVWNGRVLVAVLRGAAFSPWRRVPRAARRGRRERSPDLRRPGGCGPRRPG